MPSEFLLVGFGIAFAGRELALQPCPALQQLVPLVGPGSPVKLGIEYVDATLDIGLAAMNRLAVSESRADHQDGQE
jgi:hypothetical protein